MPALTSKWARNAQLAWKHMAKTGGPAWEIWKLMEQDESEKAKVDRRLFVRLKPYISGNY